MKPNSSSKNPVKSKSFTPYTGNVKASGSKLPAPSKPTSGKPGGKVSGKATSQKSSAAKRIVVGKGKG